MLPSDTLYNSFIYTILYKITSKLMLVIQSYSHLEGLLESCFEVTLVEYE